MSKPNIGFFVVGAARSGTTSLYAALGMHPDVYCPEFKEPRFFRGNQDKGWDWYASLYADATEGQILGDFSPNYMDFDRGNPVAEKIAEHYPDARIVYIVRNPISCAISNWQMGCDVFEEIIPFEEAYTGRMRGSVLLRSKFALQYKLLKRVIPKKQILVLPLEGLATTPGPYLRALQRHLGVQRHPIKYRHRNATKWKPTRPPAPVLSLEERTRFVDLVRQDAQEILAVMGLEPDFWDVSATSAAWKQPKKGAQKPAPKAESAAPPAQIPVEDVPVKASVDSASTGTEGQDSAQDNTQAVVPSEAQPDSLPETLIEASAKSKPDQV